MSQNSSTQIVNDALLKQRTFLAPKLSSALDEKTKEVLKTLGFKDIDPVKADHLANEIAQAASADVMENIGRIQDFSASSAVIADSITQGLLAHPLTRPQAIKMNEAEIYRKTEKQIGNLLTKFQIQNDLEKAAVLANLASLNELEKPSTELQAQIASEVDRHVQEKSPLAPEGINNTLKANTFQMTKTYTENLKAKTQLMIEKEQVPTIAQLNNLKTETFNQASTQITLNTSQFKEKVDPKGLAERISYVLDLKPMDQNQTETLGLGGSEPKILTFTKGAGVGGFTVGFGISNNQSAQVGAYNTLLAYDRGWLEKTAAAQTQQIDTVRKKSTPTLSDIIKANSAQKKLLVLQNARAFQVQNPGLAEAYQTYFQSRPAGSRLHTSSQAAQNTTSAHFNNYRGAWSPRSLSANSGYLAQRTFGGLAFKFGDSRLGSISKAMKISKGLASEASVPLMISSATQKLMKKMAKITGLGFGAVALYFMKLGAAALKGFVIGAAIGGTVGAGTGAALGLAIAAPFGPFAPLVAVVTVPLGAVIGGFVGATLGGVAGGLIAYGLASGTATAITTGAGVAIGGAIGTYVGAVAGAAAVAWIPVVGPFLAPVGALVGAAVGAYVGALIGGSIGYVIGHYIIGTIGAPLTGAATGAAVGFYVAGPPGALVGAGVGYLATGGWHQVGDFITGTGGATGSAIGATGSFITGAASAFWGGASSLAGSILGGASTIASSVWSGITSISFSAQVIALPVAGSIVTVFTYSILGLNTTSASFFNNQADQIEGSGPPPISNQFIDISKLVSAPGLSLGPATSIQFGDDKLAQNLNYDIKVTAKNKVTGLNCTDKLTLVQKNGTIEDISALLPIPLPPTPVPCNDLDNGGVLSFSFSVSIPNEDKYKDAVIVNKFSLSGSGQGSTTDTNYYIPLRDQNTNLGAISGVKQRALDGRYPDNLINASCPGGKNCWDYVIAQSRSANINPTFILAIWYEESHFSDVGNHFSCPVSQPRTHDGTGLSGSLTCFLNLVTSNNPDNSENGFLDVVNHYCGTGTYGSGEATCSNNPNFLNQLKIAYQELGGTALAIGGTGNTAIPFTADAVAFVTVGNPPNNCPHGWPTTGHINQGPEGSYSHSDTPSNPIYGGGYEALDIGNWDSYGNPVFATVDGEVVVSNDIKGSNNQTIGIKPSNCPGLDIVYYLHLSGRYVQTNDIVSWGREIGAVGQAGTGPHNHYQFNEPFNRSFQITNPPYVPRIITPRDCIYEGEDCGEALP